MDVYVQMVLVSPMMLNGGQDQPTKFWVTAKNFKYIAYKDSSVTQIDTILNYIWTC